MLFFFDSHSHSTTLPCEFGSHRAGSQLKMSESQTKAGNQKKIENFKIGEDPHLPEPLWTPHRMPTNSKFDAWGFTKLYLTLRLETTFIRKKRLNIIKQSYILFFPKCPQMSFLAMWKLFPGHFYVWESASKWLFNVLVNLSVRSSCCVTHEI